ncbi:hypothetical protein Anapl_00851 [Anas platyrhynchos]|uniref:Uncharacterized protein n=1 Tax=Anas platyrhynchos TaxID=8839 RepID=R0K981_ANAPL|nr:hypothetical protein Anapl_00851 [Anas platyrhynchos]
MLVTQQFGETERQEELPGAVGSQTRGSDEQSEALPSGPAFLHGRAGGQQHGPTKATSSDKTGQPAARCPLQFPSSARPKASRAWRSSVCSPAGLLSCACSPGTGTKPAFVDEDIWSVPLMLCLLVGLSGAPRSSGLTIALPLFCLVDPNKAAPVSKYRELLLTTTSHVLSRSAPQRAAFSPKRSHSERRAGWEVNSVTFPMQGLESNQYKVPHPGGAAPSPSTGWAGSTLKGWLWGCAKTGHEPATCASILRAKGIPAHGASSKASGAIAVVAPLP